MIRKQIAEGKDEGADAHADAEAQKTRDRDGQKIEDGMKG